MENFGLSKDMFDPRGFVDGYNSLVAAILAVLTAIFGPHWYLFAAFLVLNVLDWLSGWQRARKLKQESSAVGLRGIVKKLWYWALIAVAFMIGKLLNMGVGELMGIDVTFLSLFGWFTLACLAVNEGRSFLENLVQMGYKVPGFLVKGLAIADKLIRDKTESVLPDVDGEEKSE